ncbi:amidase domain-containing protein [Sarocladium implicatum]|nr:amidase domain-containing protein [Sarocladium implicatum]
MATLNLVGASIDDIQNALSSGALTSVELVSRYLRRIARYDCQGSALNSIPVLNENVFVEAAASDDRRRRGEPTRHLEGIPYTVKDSYKVRGMTVAAGSPAFKDLIANDDAFTVGAIRAEGGVLIGRTNMPPMAYGGMQRGIYGRAESPYNPEYLCAAWWSGSSNGSAVSTAASMATFGMAEETVSSGRSPASNNALVAYTPSRGWLSIRGNWPLYPTCDAVVPHTRTMNDMLKLLCTLTAIDSSTAGDFWRDQPFVKLEEPWRGSAGDPAIFSAISDTTSLAGKRIAVPSMYIGGAAPDGATPVYTSEGVQEVWHNARRELEALGAEVVIVPDLPAITAYENPSLLPDGADRLPEDWNWSERGPLVAHGWNQFIQGCADPNLPGLSAVDEFDIFPHAMRTEAELRHLQMSNSIHWGKLAKYTEDTTMYDTKNLEIAVKALEAMRKQLLEHYLEKHNYDCFVFPSQGDAAAADSDISPDAAAHAFKNGVWYSNGNRALRHLGIPSVTVPMGINKDKNMPVGLTFAGRAYDDEKLLRLANAFEKKTKLRNEPTHTPALESDIIKLQPAVQRSRAGRPKFSIGHCATSPSEPGRVLVNVQGTIELELQSAAGVEKTMPVLEVVINGETVPFMEITLHQEGDSDTLFSFEVNSRTNAPPERRAECMAVNKVTATQVPRSLVQYLEQRLAELRRSESALSHSHTFGVTNGHSDSRTIKQQSHSKILELATLSVFNCLTPSLFESGDKIQHYAKLFYPSERPPLKIPVRGVYHDVHQRTAGRAYAAQSSHFEAHNIPMHVATRLFKNYKDEILPRFPCFDEEELTDLFGQFYNVGGREESAPHMPGFVVPMILAISSLTSISHDFQKVAALSESLCSDAMRHAGLLRESSIPSLQCTLLLAQLTLLLPYTSNSWYMTGEAMRMAVSLGLHQEPDPSICPDLRHAELRRKIFWTIYQLDRTVGISAGCPVALSDEHITTQLPYGGGDSHIMPEGFGLRNAQSSKEVQFLVHTRVRSIQSHIHGIQFFDQHLPKEAKSYEAWVHDTANLIERLVAQVTAEGAAKSWLAAAAQQCKVLLHRPCSRNIAVSESSLVACVTAVIQLITSYTSTVQAGGFVMAFELANSAFQAGMALLYALRNHSAVLEETSLLNTGHKALHNLPKLLASEGFLDDENWWRAFIRDDFEMDKDIMFTPALESNPTIAPPQPATVAAPPVAATPVEAPSPKETKPFDNSGLSVISKSLPAGSAYAHLENVSYLIRFWKETFHYGARIGFLIDNIREAERDKQSTVTSTGAGQSTWLDQIVFLPLRPSTQAPVSVGSQTLFFGPWTSLGLLRRYIGRKGVWETPRIVRQAIQFSPYGLDPTATHGITLPPISTAVSLCQLFARSANVFYRIMDQPTLDGILSYCYSNNQRDSHDGTHEILYLVFAIASVIGKRSDPGLAAQAESYFAKATSRMSTTCDHSSRDANIMLLQRTLLICIYLRLKPGSGDVWRHLGFAIRHFFDLAHRPSMEEDKYHDTLCTLTRTLYCLESQVSIAFGRPSLLSIGDDLRQDLTKGPTDDVEDRVSVFSYLISFQMMQIHSALLRYDADPNRTASDGNRAPGESFDYRRGLDEWLVRWKEFVMSLPDDESRINLLCWGQFNYYHGIFLVSLLWPTPGGTTPNLCESLAQAGLQLMQHQQLFGQPCSGTWEKKPPLVYPVTWTTGYAVHKVGLHALAADALTVEEERERTVSLGRCSSLLMVLEADPDNLLTGMSLVFEKMRSKA